MSLPSRRTLVAGLSAAGALSTVAGPEIARAAAAVASSADAAFADLGRRTLDGMFRLNPVMATATGDHRFDTVIDDMTPAGRRARVDEAKARLAELGRIDRASLSRANQVDAAILSNRLRYIVWEDETLQGWAWDPLGYNDLAGGALYSLMAREFAPLPVRLRSATARMERLPTLFAQVRAALQPARVPAIHAFTYAKQNKGVVSLIDGLILPGAGSLSAPDRARLMAAAATAKAAVAQHQLWIDGTLVPAAKGDWRLGAALFDAKLALALDSPLSRPEIKSRAQAEMVRIRAQMYALAQGVLRGRPGAPPTPASPTPAQQQAAIAAALRLSSEDRPARDQLVATAERALAQATAFVRAKDLITLPAAPVKVITMPEFQQGVAVAYCDPPGALEKQLGTFYAVSPIPKDWTAAQVESFTREYSNRGIQEITVHEAMPGHYVQLAHSNQYPSTLRAVFWSGPFVEGWAVYAQDLMADQGYLNGDPLYKLAHLKLQLRTISNAILDQGVHVDGMTEAQAMRLMTQDAFQEEREAAGKWTRARVSSAQLSTYFVGWQEHLATRAEMERREGAGFNLKRYHDTVLSFGSPPGRYVRQLMTGAAIA